MPPDILVTDDCGDTGQVSITLARLLSMSLQPGGAVMGVMQSLLPDVNTHLEQALLLPLSPISRALVAFLAMHIQDVVLPVWTSLDPLLGRVDADLLVSDLFA